MHDVQLHSLRKEKSFKIAENIRYKILGNKLKKHYFIGNFKMLMRDIKQRPE